MDETKPSLWRGILIGVIATVLGGLIVAVLLRTIDPKPRLFWFDLHHVRSYPDYQADQLYVGVVVVGNSGRAAARDVVLTFDGSITLGHLDFSPFSAGQGQIGGLKPA